MRNIKLTESDCTFVHYVLRMYATANTWVRSMKINQKSVK